MYEVWVWTTRSCSQPGPPVFSSVMVWLVPQRELEGGRRMLVALRGSSVCHAAVLSHFRPLDANARLAQMHSWAPLQVLQGDADVLFPVSGAGSYGPAGGCSPMTCSVHS